MKQSSGGPVLAVLAVLVLALPIGLAVVGGAGQGTTSASIVTVAALAAQTCSITGPVKGLTPDQAANADKIVAGSMNAAAENARAARVALMTAITVSHLENLDPGNGGPLGVFQQLPSQGWGTPAQLMDTTYSSVAFVTRLLALPKWESLPPSAAANEVEGPAASNEAGYRRNWARAGTVLTAVLANADAPGGCGQGVGAPTGTGHGLPPGYVIPPGTPPEHAKVVGFALRQLGKPYLWGGAGPAAYDCSGLTMAAWATVGVALPHAASLQQDDGVPVTDAQLVPGDLVLVPGTDSPGPGLAGHVGIYLGDGLVLSAIDTDYGVAVQSWSMFVSGGLIALRDLAPGA